MENLNFKLESFEGPLDLLLHLISKHKMNIFDIEISLLLEQYMAYINKMQSMDMEIASEFLEMAARLVQIKTLSLLPKHEEEEQLRRELTGQLVEYSLCKKAAQILGTKYCGNDIFSRAQTEIEVDKTYTRIHEQNVLSQAYLSMLGKTRAKLPPKQEEFHPIVTKRVVSVSSRVIFVLKNLYRKKKMQFLDLFKKSQDKSEMVATFLAILELIKNKRVIVDDDNNVNLLKGGTHNDN